MEKTKRDEHNMLDIDDADRRLRELQKTLVTETIAHNKDISFNKTGRDLRDIVVKFVIYRKNTVDGMVVREDYNNALFENLSGDPMDPYRYQLVEYVDGDIEVRDQPMTHAAFGKWLHSCFVAVTNFMQTKLQIIDLRKS